MGLVLSRRKGQSIVLELGRALRIRVKVTECHRSSCKLHIDAPNGIDVVRGELVAELPELALYEDRSKEQLAVDGDEEHIDDCASGLGQACDCGVEDGESE